MIAITSEMREMIDSALADRAPCILGSVSGSGEPQISLKGSVMVYDEETLAYWERARRSSFRNVAENPNVVVFYRNPEKRVTWRFHGAASIHEAGPLRQEVMDRTVQSELDRDPERRGPRCW